MSVDVCLGIHLQQNMHNLTKFYFFKPSNSNLRDSLVLINPKVSDIISKRII